MTNELSKTEYWDIEVQLAKLYLYLLPIRMLAQLGFLQSLLHGAGGYLDVLLHGVGLLLLCLRRRGVVRIGADRASRLMQYFAGMVLFFNASSLLMAAVIQLTYGNYAGETAFSGIFGMFLYFIQYALMIFYNKHVFQMISKQEILKIMQRFSIFLLVLGYWQILILSFGGIFAQVMEAVDVFQILYPSWSMPKLSLTTTEGASAGNLISILVMPFLYSQLLTEGKKARYIVQILCWLPVVYFTFSSTAYILFVAVTAVFLILYCIRCGRNGAGAILLFLLCLVLLAALVFPQAIASLLPDEVGNQIRYLLVEKISDTTNGSVSIRTTPFHINFGAFSEYPLLGVGNGLQGYFFEKYVPDSFFTTPGYDAQALYFEMTSTISNGSLFFPSILSGYGIVGATLFLGYVLKLIKLARDGREQLGSFYAMFLLSAVAVLLTGLQGDFCGKYYLWFMMSIPYMADLPQTSAIRAKGDKGYEKTARFGADTDHEPPGVPQTDA